MREIGVHHEQRVTARRAESRDDRRRETGLARPSHDAHGIRLAEPIRDLRRAVGRSVVDDDEFPLRIGERFRESFNETRERVGFVVCGDDDRDERARSLGVPSVTAVRVTFDARHLQTVARVRGIGRYSRNLLAAFARTAPPDIEWTLLRLRNFPSADAAPLPPHRDLRTLRLRRPELSMLALDPVLLSFELPFARPQVYHSVQLGLPAVRRFRAIVTIHDLAPLRWPEHYLRLPHARVGHAWQYALARRADAIIAVSEATKRDVIERLRVPESRVRVIPEAVDASFAPPARDAALTRVRERFSVTSPYVLYVGQFDPRKNMDGLVSAFARAAERHRDLRLVIAGDLGKLAPFLYDALDRGRAPRERVALTGHVSDVDLAALYAGAECLLHAALLEGFGLTPLESLAAGTPVVGLRAGAVEEVVGEAGILVDDRPEALADALLRYLEDDVLRGRLRSLARGRASRFSWDSAAEATLALYRAV
ncbi:MAG: glycosyltransferase family 4 protein [Chloroflexi bacterium]|nr:MAG: glycosyltransferase family 4 protein [Chloroflexota bacterium]